MDAVPLIELGISADAFQEERDQRRPVLFCDCAEDSAAAPTYRRWKHRSCMPATDDRRAGLLGPHLID